MQPVSARTRLLEQVRPTRQLVTLAKAFLMTATVTRETNVSTLLDGFAQRRGYPRIDRVALRGLPAETIEENITKAAQYWSCRIAAAHAMRELISASHFYEEGANRVDEPNQGWTDVVAGTGTTAGWSFPELCFGLPSRIYRSPVSQSPTEESLTDPDVFVLEAGIQGADPEVVEALKDAVGCLRHELYRPAITMLGKAMEGSWIELGLGLARMLPTTGANPQKKLEDLMKDDNRSIAAKIKTVRDHYAQPNFEPVAKASGIRPVELDTAVIWSNVVRESRNAIHFGARPTLPNTYATVTVLFMDGANALNMLYRIKAAVP